MVKNLPAKAGDARDTSSNPPLGVEDPLEEGVATHSSVLAWRIHGQRKLAGCSPQGHTESDRTELT